MKKIICVIITVVLTACIAGCQKTPESPVVVGKNVDLLIDKATESDRDSTQTPTAKSIDYAAILAERLGVPERFVVSESYSDGRLTCSADARIILPDVSALPVMRVEPEDFSQELVDRLYDTLVGDTPMYQQQVRYTKQQIEEELVYWRQILNDPESEEISKEQTEEKITELEAGYNSALDSPEMIPADATIGTQQEIDFQSGEIQCEYSGADLAQIPGVKVQEGKKFSIRNNTKDGEIIIKENVGGWEVTDTASQGASFYYTNYDFLKGYECYVRVETVTPDSLTDRPERVSEFSYEDALDTVDVF